MSRTTVFDGNLKADSFLGALTSYQKTTSTNLSLPAEAKLCLAVGITASAASKTVTLGLSAGQVMFVSNTGGANAFTLKNVSGDTGTSLAAGKVALVVASDTADGSLVYVLN